MAVVRVVSLEKANSGMPYFWKGLGPGGLEMESLEAGWLKMRRPGASLPVSPMRSSRIWFAIRSPCHQAQAP